LADQVQANQLTAGEIAARIRAGELTAETVARACLARIAARDPDVRAWSFVDPDAVIRTARELDKGPIRGPLHGVPIGVKDMIDTADMPTQHNSPIFVGHRPSLDAAPVATLRAAGAIILGKTDTTEFAAAGRWAATRHPLDPRHSPGGSSAGSAAAVADCQVPVALGTQTAGSTMRPASFCGVFAFKPSWGAVSREGLKLYAASLDTLTWFARGIADLDLLCEVFAIADDAPPVAVPVRGARIALCRSPAWRFAQPGTEAAMATAEERLRLAGAVVAPLDLPESFAELGFAIHQAVMFSEGRAAFLNLSRTHKHLLHDDFLSRTENRANISRAQLLAAYDQAAACRVAFDAIARDYDAVVTPSARGEAPPLSEGPGDAVFNRMWTLLHVPCVNVPVGNGPGGLPVGVTLVGPRFGDRQLLATARGIAATLAAERP
jgi:Asp-tRNA(Asn)/Glu-tRNA(Gln) amidotransferase A subunit family amidase